MRILSTALLAAPFCESACLPRMMLSNNQTSEKGLKLYLPSSKISHISDTTTSSWPLKVHHLCPVSRNNVDGTNGESGTSTMHYPQNIGTEVMNFSENPFQLSTVLLAAQFL